MQQVTLATEIPSFSQRYYNGMCASTIRHGISKYPCLLQRYGHVKFRSLTSGSVLGCLGCPYRYDGILNQGPTVSLHTTLFIPIYMMLTNTPVPQPLIRRAKIIQMWFWAEHCSAAPRIAQAAPKAIVRTRPILSPTQPPTRHPTRVPK